MKNKIKDKKAAFVAVPCITVVEKWWSCPQDAKIRTFHKINLVSLPLLFMACLCVFESHFDEYIAQVEDHPPPSVPSFLLLIGQHLLFFEFQQL